MSSSENLHRRQLGDPSLMEDFKAGYDRHGEPLIEDKSKTEPPSNTGFHGHNLLDILYIKGRHLT
jgi:hypothetical protein